MHPEKHLFVKAVYNWATPGFVYIYIYICVCVCVCVFVCMLILTDSPGKKKPRSGTISNENHTEI